MYCIKCNETLEGNGYTSPVHCPNISEEQHLELDRRECDSDVLYCEFNENEDEF